ncbi:hypothetical protein Poli38472_009972 [Pythium oligandrum]|uniref:Pectin acetylesterase n=1 Tax=Pythium oligandrum TaxID=41045 RepID=A0A8K1C8L0_PYTOL|nr:hypothetical protein Poli38472_009972 [Pythium oligandrum]|eukprot:TMW58413.1 hypothetical protein Poli38472_009972 [Pythium oligandrum]
MVPRPNVLSGILAVVLAITLHYLYEVYEASLQSGQDCSYASGDACPVDSLKISDTDGSALIYPGGETRCAFDDFTDPKTGFSTNSTYFFQVFPKPERKKLLIMFQGGGGCFDDTACNFAMQCSLGTSTFTTVATASNTGVFNSSDPENVFKDWNIVHIPYCTGDMHSGSKVVDGVDTGHEGVFNHAQCLNQNMPLHLNGFENSKAALAWAKTNYPEVDELVVSGMSAGSMAAQTWAIYIADLWNVPSSETRYGILADSCMGVLPAEYPVGKMFDYVGMCDLDLKLPPSVVDACKAGTLTMNEIVSASLKALPESRWAFLNSKSDGDQRFFYQFIKDGILGFPFPDILPEADFHETVLRFMDTYKEASSYISSFLVEGSQHIFLTELSYSDTVSVAGQSLGEFVAQWLS